MILPERLKRFARLFSGSFCRCGVASHALDQRYSYVLDALVNAKGKAAEIGFQEGDVILKAGNKDVSRPDDFKAAMSEAKAAGKKNMLVLLKRGSALSHIAVPVAMG